MRTIIVIVLLILVSFFIYQNFFVKSNISPYLEAYKLFIKTYVPNISSSVPTFVVYYSKNDTIFLTNILNYVDPPLTLLELEAHKIYYDDYENKFYDIILHKANFSLNYTDIIANQIITIHYQNETYFFVTYDKIGYFMLGIHSYVGMLIPEDFSKLIIYKSSNPIWILDEGGEDVKFATKYENNTKKYVVIFTVKKGYLYGIAISYEKLITDYLLCESNVCVYDINNVINTSIYVESGLACVAMNGYVIARPIAIKYTVNNDTINIVGEPFRICPSPSEVYNDIKSIYNGTNISVIGTFTPFLGRIAVPIIPDSVEPSEFIGKLYTTFFGVFPSLVDFENLYYDCLYRVIPEGAGDGLVGDGLVSIWVDIKNNTILSYKYLLVVGLLRKPLYSYLYIYKDLLDKDYLFLNLTGRNVSIFYKNDRYGFFTAGKDELPPLCPDTSTNLEQLFLFFLGDMDSGLPSFGMFCENKYNTLAAKQILLERLPNAINQVWKIANPRSALPYISIENGVIYLFDVPSRRVYSFSCVVEDNGCIYKKPSTGDLVYFTNLFGVVTFEGLVLSTFTLGKIQPFIYVDEKYVHFGAFSQLSNKIDTIVFIIKDPYSNETILSNIYYDIPNNQEIIIPINSLPNKLLVAYLKVYDEGDFASTSTTFYGTCCVTEEEQQPKEQTPTEGLILLPPSIYGSNLTINLTYPYLNYTLNYTYENISYPISQYPVKRKGIQSVIETQEGQLLLELAIIILIVAIIVRAIKKRK